MTDPEVILWSRLRTRRPGEPTFRRQYPVGPYILDFYCSAARVAVEVDGYIHGTGSQPAHDLRRDAWLKGQGLTVYRISAASVMDDVVEVADGVRALARELSGADG